MLRCHFGVLFFVSMLGLAPSLQCQQGQEEHVLIKARKPYEPLVSKIEALGGKVSYQYKNIDAIAATVPLDSLAAVRSAAGAAAVGKDELVPAPAAVDTSRGRRGPASSGAEYQIEAESVEAIDADALPAMAAANPNAYMINNALMKVDPLHAGGFAGQEIIVALIDTGIRPGFPHITLDGSVIGCEDFVNDGLGCSNTANNGHGTFVAGMVSANVVFSFSASSAFRNAVLAECPACFLNPPANTLIPMVGTAPLSSIYALRIFAPTGSAPLSRIFAAMDRVIDLRSKYDAGDPTGVKIQVCNMSLGGSGLAIGRDLYNSMVEAMLRHDIVLTVAAGNAGPSSLTIGNPAGAFASLNVGAASLSHNERILRRSQYGPAVGALYRPFLGHQTSYFSSRGPNADGRPDPDVTANGFASFGQGLGSSPGSISLASGTSFSAPTVAGIAAVLRQKYPRATAAQIRKAIIMSADPTVLSDGSSNLDQGSGFVDASAAAALLDPGTVPDVIPVPGSYGTSVKVNIEMGTSLNVWDGFVRQHFSNLKPGQRFEIPYRVAPNTKQVVVVLSRVLPALPPAQQNQLFGDDVILAVHSAKTSAIGEGDYRVFEFTLGGTFAVDNPESGIMRVTVSGDWTNAGTISGDIVILALTEPIPRFTTSSKVNQDQTLVFPVDIPAGVSTGEFRLAWRDDWGTYPTGDLDLILVSPDGTPNFDGAALNNPETALLKDPAPGTWIALIDGYFVPTGTDKFEFRVSLDGKIVR